MGNFVQFLICSLSGIRKPALYIALIFFIVSSLVLIISIFYLNYQCDPFVSTTVILGQYIAASGNIDQTSDFFLNSAVYGNSWQSHAKDFILYVPFSGLLVAIIATVSGLPTITICYLPGPYIAMCLILFCLLREVYRYCKDTEIKNTARELLILTVLSVSVFTFFFQYCIGQWYLFEYHAMNLVFELGLYFLFLKLALTKKSGSKECYILILIIYASLSFTHYNFPLSIIGALLLLLSTTFFIYPRSAFRQKHYLSFVHLLIIFALFLSFQQFYTQVLSQTDGMLNVLSTLSQLITERVSSVNSGQSSDSIYPFIESLKILKKMFHIIFLIVLLLLCPTLIYYLRKVGGHVSLIPLMFLLVLGINLTWIVTYVAVYGFSFSLQLKDIWILNIFILIPIVLLNKAQSTSIKRIGALLCLLLLISNVCLVGWITYELDFKLGGYSVFPYQVKENSLSACNFILCYTDQPSKVSGSLQTTSSLFEQMYYYDSRIMNNVYPTFFPAKNHLGAKRNATDAYYSIKQGGVSRFIITKYELDNYFYGELSAEPFTNNEVMELNQMMEYDDLIFNSDKARVYALK